VLHLPSSASRPEAISILIAERMRLEIEETRGA
jgi:hypothetical protein